MNPPAMTGANLSQPVDKGLPVVIGFENFLSSVATGHHMGYWNRVGLAMPAPTPSLIKPP